ncbi:MAG: ArnT family glycosyltransferase [Sphingomonas sp.]|uniref:ArnT family glycosyltransferase n=1 Tax=Sphingomonas sp. TaxID=28214 RepID=UPI003F810277
MHDRTSSAGSARFVAPPFDNPLFRVASWPGVGGLARRGTDQWWVRAVLLLIVALASRAPLFGNPVIQVDEQFYLFTGDHMLHGAWPFIGIWDRKPVGLFVLYAGLRALGGTGILSYQIAEMLSVAATAFVIERMARIIAPPSGALFAGILYILCLPIMGGIGGQAPVFYNLPMAAAALIMLRLVAADREDAARRLRGQGALAMLLVGIAIQIKYSAVFEGFFFGVVLMALSLRRRSSVFVALAESALWASIALLPTAVAFAAYCLAGHGQDFLFANFWSIFLRSGDPVDQTLGRFWGMVAFTAPLIVAGCLAPFANRDTEGRSALYFSLSWAACACAAVIAFGSYFDHYALPLYAPLCLVAAPLLGLRRVGPRVGVVLIVAALIAGTLNVWRDVRKRGDWATVAPMVAMIGQHPKGCVYIFDGDPIIYHLTQSCLLTRWPFPPHLANRRETNALGVNAVAETRRIMEQRPSWVITTRGPDSGLTNRADAAIVDRALGNHYALVMEIPIGPRVRQLYRLEPEQLAQR